MDWLVFRSINRWAGQSPVLDAVMMALGGWVSLVGPLLFFGFWFMPGPSRPRRRLAVVLAGIAVLIGLGLTDVPSFVMSRDRPWETHRVTVLVANPPAGASFPSQHVAATAAMVAGLGPHLGRWSLVAWLLTVGAALARVFVGVHYPSDVLVGFLMGWLAGAVVYHNRDVLEPFASRVVSLGEELL
ncbi:MAG TPA: phosphatase PAP2 family protein [Symbiobacteriaceae bacterium]|nr:phosphatase PAP2 family protein [Symbiobacteriaceae bacterium]